MFSRVIGLVGDAAEQRLNQTLRSVVPRLIVILMALVAVGFLTAAGYQHLYFSSGGIRAALIIAAIYAFLAALIWIIWVPVKRKRNNKIVEPIAVESTTDPILQSLSSSGLSNEHLGLLSALKLGGAISPLQALGLAVVIGFFAGRKRLH